MRSPSICALLTYTQIHRKALSFVFEDTHTIAYIANPEAAVSNRSDASRSPYYIQDEIPLFLYALLHRLHNTHLFLVQCDENMAEVWIDEWVRSCTCILSPSLTRQKHTAMDHSEHPYDGLQSKNSPILYRLLVVERGNYCIESKHNVPSP